MMSFELSRIFVLDIDNQPAFAFEARDWDAAQRAVRSEWLLQALDAFCRTRRPAISGRLQIRDATDNEVALYRDRADEFADTTPDLLIAHLTQP
jgi:hypothetical protein